MPIVKLLAACMTASFVAHAMFTFWYETDSARYTSPVIFLAFAWVFASLFRRKFWAWKVSMFCAMATTVINIAFLPSEKFFGQYLLIAQIFAGVEILLAGSLWYLIPKPSTSNWLLGAKDESRQV